MHRLLFCFVLALLLLQTIPSVLAHKPPARQACTVLTVYDGDTFACDLNHNGVLDVPADRIRLLGIDAPEMSYSRKNHSGRDQPCAAQAKDVLEGHYGKTVYLAFDLKRIDRYGRTLAFVYPRSTSRVSLNESLLIQGLAKVMFLPPNAQWEGRFLQVALDARKARRGVWH